MFPWDVSNFKHKKSLAAFILNSVKATVKTSGPSGRWRELPQARNRLTLSLCKFSLPFSVNKTGLLVVTEQELESESFCLCPIEDTPVWIMGLRRVTLETSHIIFSRMSRSLSAGFSSTTCLCYLLNAFSSTSRGLNHVCLGKTGILGPAKGQCLIQGAPDPWEVSQFQSWAEKLCCWDDHSSIGTTGRLTVTGAKERFAQQAGQVMSVTRNVPHPWDGSGQDGLNGDGWWADFHCLQIS